MIHKYELKIYHADTDCYGIVWHGNYLRFCEQARCHLVEQVSKGMKYFEDNNILTPLVEANLKYKNPAKIHDTILIETTVEKISPLKATLLQKISNKDTGLAVADITVSFVCTDKNGKLYRKIPQEMLDMLKNYSN